MLKHKWVINVSITIATILLCFFSFEGVLRVFYPTLLNNRTEEPYIQYDPILGWNLMPNTSASIRYYKGGSHPDGETFKHIINSKGLRGDEYAYDKPLNIKRILLLGDSFTFGSEVDDNNTISQNMNYLLNKYNYQVLNGGVPGYGTIQEYLFLSQEGMKYCPDIVLTLFFAGNDGTDNIGIDMTGVIKKASPVIQDGKIIPVIDNQHKNASSALNPLESFALDLYHNSSVMHVVGRAYSKFIGFGHEREYERQVRETVFSLNEIDKMCKNINVKHIVVLVPDGIVFNNDESVAKSYKDYLHKFTGDIISNLIISNIDFIDLQPLLNNPGPLEDYYFVNEGAPEHFTPKGYRIVANILAEKIIDMIESDLAK